MVNVYTRSSTGGTTWGSARIGGFGQFDQGYARRQSRNEDLAGLHAPDQRLDRPRRRLAGADRPRARPAPRVSREHVRRDEDGHVDPLVPRHELLGLADAGGRRDRPDHRPFQIDQNYAVGGRARRPSRHRRLQPISTPICSHVSSRTCSESPTTTRVRSGRGSPRSTQDGRRGRVRGHLALPEGDRRLRRRARDAQLRR